jgi:hypothetical protein
MELETRKATLSHCHTVTSWSIPYLAIPLFVCLGQTDERTAHQFAESPLSESGGIGGKDQWPLLTRQYEEKAGMP